MGLQAFHLAQFPYPLATVLISNVLVTTTLLTKNRYNAARDTFAAED